MGDILALHGPREMWRRATPESSLFLSSATQLNCAQLRPLYDWICAGLWFHDGVPSGGTDELSCLINDPASKALLLQLLRSLDVQVTDLRVVERENRHGSVFDKSDAGDRNVSVELFHAGKGDTGGWVPPARESAGIRDLLLFVASLIRAARTEALLVVDDFGRHWHPIVSRALLALMRDLSGSTVQLLATSHEVEVMDLNSLRRDQLWLIEQNADGASHLSPVLRRAARSSGVLTRRYIRGRLGGIPKVRS